MKSKYFKLVLCGLLLNACMNAKIKEGNEEFSNLQYSDAIKAYRAADRKNDNREVKTFYENFGMAYNKINDYHNAEKYFSIAYNSGNITPEGEVDYAQVLMSDRHYDKAVEVLDKYLTDKPNDQRAKDMRQACLNMDIQSTKFQYITYPIDELNSNGYSTFSPAQFGQNKIIFVTERNQMGNRNNDWNNKPYLDIFTAEKMEDGNFNKIEPLPGKVNSMFHDGPGVFSRNTDTIYYTQSDFEPGSRELQGERYNEYKLVMATYNTEKQKWNDPTELWFNEKGYSFGHPTLSKDGQTMIFSSTKPGGKGEGDLYITRLLGGAWSVPINLGDKINTEGSEMFPFLSETQEKTTLYFSSDGHQGFGDLDIFMVDLNGDEWGEIIHFDEPINSTKDDFGILVTENGNGGYFSSNRFSEDLGIDKIYGFSKLNTDIFVKGTVIDKDTKEKIPYADINIINNTLNRNHRIVTDSKGQFMDKLVYNSDYMAYAYKKSYAFDYEDFKTQIRDQAENDTIFITLELDRFEVNSVYVLENIYYDLDKYNIRPDAAKELDELVVILNSQPNIDIELGSHTDCRQSDSYNLKLSKNRAKAAVEYLVSKGIDRKRLTYKGYGETKLINDCNCDSGEAPEYDCTPEEHQKNRRTEFKITKIRD